MNCLGYLTRPGCLKRGTHSLISIKPKVRIKISLRGGRGSVATLTSLNSSQRQALEEHIKKMAQCAPLCHVSRWVLHTPAGCCCCAPSLGPLKRLSLGLIVWSRLVAFKYPVLRCQIQLLLTLSAQKRSSNLHLFVWSFSLTSNDPNDKPR